MLAKSVRIALFAKGSTGRPVDLTVRRLCSAAHICGANWATRLQIHESIAARFVYVGNELIDDAASLQLSNEARLRQDCRHLSP